MHKAPSTLPSPGSDAVTAAVIDCSDKQTIGVLYQKMSRAAIAKAASIVRRQDVAAEIAHDSFIKLWQSGGRFPNEKAVYAWIYKTCHRAAIDHLRSAAHRREDYGESAEESIAMAPSVQPNTGGDRYRDVVMTRELVQRYVSTLKPQEAEAFLYIALDGMTQNEVCEVMGLSRRTVQRLLARVEKIFAEVRNRDES